MSYQQAPERVTVTLPEEVKDMFAWMKAFDPQFEGRDASIAAFLIKLGVEAYYQRGLENAEPLEQEIIEAMMASTTTGLSESLNDESPIQAQKAASGGN